MKSTKSSTKQKGIKIVVRNLPPSLDEPSMREQLGELPATPIYWKFCTPNPHLDYKASPYLFIAFANEDDAINFADRFNGFIFVDAKGASSSALVELAPNNNIPKITRDQVSKDPEIGKVTETKEFKQFVDNLQAPVTRLTIDEQLRIIDEKRSKNVVGEITPLAKFVLDQHIQKRDRLEERRRIRDDERKAKRDKRKANRAVSPEEEENETEGRIKGQKLLEFVKRTEEKESVEASSKQIEPTTQHGFRKKEQQPKVNKRASASGSAGKAIEENASPRGGASLESFKPRIFSKTGAVKESENKIEERNVVKRNPPARTAEKVEEEKHVKETRERKPKVEREIYRPGRLRKAKEEAAPTVSDNKK